EGKARARPYLCLHAQRQFDGDAAGHRQPRAGKKLDLRLYRRQKIEPGGAAGGIKRQGQVRAMRQFADADFHAAPRRWPAMRAARRVPTSALVISGQSSTPFSLIRWTRL